MERSSTCGELIWIHMGRKAPMETSSTDLPMQFDWRYDVEISLEILEISLCQIVIVT